MSNPYLRLAAPGVRSLHPYQPGKPISELEREFGVHDSIKLASNENPLGPGQAALQAIGRSLDDLALYPDGSGHELRQALAQHHRLDPACITLGNGSNDVLVLLAEAFLTPADEAVYSQYAFAVYPLAVQAVGAVARVADAHPPEHRMPLGHDLAAMEALVSERTRLVFIANPNNPTGTWVDEGSLREFIGRLPPDALVVVDEAYFDYVTESAYPDTSTWLDEFPNLVVTRTFSKAHGLAGLRVGYALSSPEIADVLNRVRQPFNVNSLAQVAAAASLTDQAHLRRSREVNAHGLAQLGAACAELGLPCVPSVGNFLLVDMGRPAGEIYTRLLHEAIIVRPVGNYGLPEHLRITIGTETQNQRLIEALPKVLLR